MSSELTPGNPAERWETAIVDGNLEKLQPSERLELVRRICAATGLTMETQPFQYLRLSGKLVLYARRDATDQLRRVHKVSIQIVSRETVGDCYIVTARATTADGRTDESTGAVSIKGLTGDALANATMKAETKSKRRVTLSICGLGMLDESEVETIHDAAPAPQAMQQIEAKPAAKAGPSKVTSDMLAQIKAAHAEAKLGDKYWGEIRTRYGVASSKELTQAQASEILDELMERVAIMAEGRKDGE